jgi:hypothetical protein
VTSTNVRCRLGLHRWTTLSAGDGLQLRRCRGCGIEQGPFPAPEAPIRLDPRDVPPP